MILKKLQKYKNFNDIKALRMASQAYDEGSIPFTRFDVVLPEQPHDHLFFPPNFRCAYLQSFLRRRPADLDLNVPTTDPLGCLGSRRASACHVL
jgi:hypothetical protein